MQYLAENLAYGIAKMAESTDDTGTLRRLTQAKAAIPDLVRETELKRKHDEEMIAEWRQRYGIEHQYSFDTWTPWTGNGYIKSWYDLRFPDGTILRNKWPNAGVFLTSRGRIDETSGVEVRLSQTFCN